MVHDFAFYLVETLSILSTALNAMLLAIYFLRPLKINSSKYFIPLGSIINILYSLLTIVLVPRAFAWNYCWTLVTSGILDSYVASMSFLALFWSSFLLVVLAATNVFLHRYLQLCKSKYFATYSTFQGFLLLLGGNALIVLNWVSYLYHVVWPTSELSDYLRVPVLNNIGLDVSEVAFVGLCVEPQPPWSHFVLIIDTMTMLFLLAIVGIYWAVQINTTLKRSSLSNQAKAMQRRMNYLLVIQTACPVMLLHTPALAQYGMMFGGNTSGTVVVCCTQALWALFPVLCPLITFFFLKEYRSLLFTKIGLRYRSTIGAMDTVTSFAAIQLPTRRPSTQNR